MTNILHWIHNNKKNKDFNSRGCSWYLAGNGYSPYFSSCLVKFHCSSHPIYTSGYFYLELFLTKSIWIIMIRKLFSFEGVFQCIVNRGIGYETLPWKQWCYNLCWKGRDPAQSFVLTFTPQLNILAKTFRLVSCSNTFQILLLCVQGQRQKGKQKHITKKFVMFHSHCLWD